MNNVYFYLCLFSIFFYADRSFGALFTTCFKFRELGTYSCSFCRFPCQLIYVHCLADYPFIVFLAFRCIYTLFSVLRTWMELISNKMKSG